MKSILETILHLPLFCWCNWMLKRCHYSTYTGIPQIYYNRYRHLVAIRREDGSWHVRSRYRLFFSRKQLEQIAAGTQKREK